MPSLRVRLMGSVALALILSLALGGALTIRQARHSVARELGSALVVARQTVHASLDNLASQADPASDLRQLVAAFDGNRHVRAVLLGSGSAPITQSTLGTAREQMPSWFVRLIGVPGNAEELAVPPIARPIATVRIETDPRNEVLEVWNELSEMAAPIAVLVISSGLLIWWSTTRVLRPLSALSAALNSVGAGEFEARLPAGGLPETQVIAAAFNRMAEDLSAVRERNRALYRQLLTAHEAERKDLARDLHDDIGPLLLAVTIDAAAIEKEIATRAPDADPTLRAIRETIGQAQQNLRAIVNRLRPIGLAEFGLRRAVANLVLFWQRRHPEVDFSLDLGEGFEPSGELGEVTVFRIVQEALINALRHGAPSCIRVAFRLEGNDGFVVKVSDDGKGAEEAKPGFGLIGMRDRVEAAGGQLTTGTGPDGGFTVMAILPQSAKAPSAEMAELPP
ncbi:sensor histidine kinase [Aliidongia dinghuensis]|uniref:Sensor histidine kinase n=1 Tax=Aliidongia dinghuensis TaxID=1867774 RepID=A0A8J3E275_9PROT|nr:sensor histidine kinase [Aliidongia dinghuensis]